MKATEKQYIVATDFEEVEPDDFYLTDEWAEKTSFSGDIKTLRQAAKERKLYNAWVINAVDYLTYGQMDAHHIIIDENNDEVISCESDVIGNKHTETFPYEGY